jgi:hypothetical protein
MLQQHDDQQLQQYVTVYLPVVVDIPHHQDNMISRGVWREGVFLPIGLELDVDSLAEELKSCPNAIASTTHMTSVTHQQQYRQEGYILYEDTMDIADDKDMMNAQTAGRSASSQQVSTTNTSSLVPRRNREKKCKAYQPNGKRPKEKISTVYCNGVRSHFYRCYW